MHRPWLCAVLLAGCGRLSFDALGDAAGADAVDANDDAMAADPCDVPLAADVVALYPFETSVAQEVTGAHVPMIRGTVTVVEGRCGSGAVRFTNDGYLLIASSPDFDLATGSIELYLRTPFPTSAINQALVVRDGNMNNDGDLSLFLSAPGDVLLRFQRAGTSYFRCAPAVAANTWVHIGVSFGGTATQGDRLWIDGVEASLAASSLDGSPVDCTMPIPAGGLTGNTNALLFGASNARAAAGAADPAVEQFLIGASLDQIVIRSTWRDFSR